MFESITPEQAGLPSTNIDSFIQVLEENGCVTHSLLLMKNGKLFAEHYWAPFHKDFNHRQYSQTKSFVGVAIGLLLEDGKLTLNDTIVSHFPEKLHGRVPENLAKMTVRNMLTMCTCGSPKNHWFWSDDTDRTHQYLNENPADHLPGFRWTYDSAGSQALCSLVEKLAQKPLLAFLKERLFDAMGVLDNARMLQCKNNDSWGDSAMLCTARDMAAFGHLVMHYGNWQGRQLMSEAYLREATSPLVNNDIFGFDSFFRQGYGYQIWRTRNGFAFVGMGDQLTVCIPDKDLIFVINSDNQGHPASRGIIMAAFFDKIVNAMADTPLPPAAPTPAKQLKIPAQKGMKTSPLMAQIDKKTFICKENKAGILHFSLHFDEKGGEFRYKNAQGDKVLPFLWNENYFGKFPQDGYSTCHGGLPNTEGYRYDCATSAAWLNGNQLMLRCQIIDKYFGNLSIRFAFNGKDADLVLTKHAEAFLDEYTGTVQARMMPL